jgi:hypothetical protein
MLAHRREVHDALNKARRVCERRRDVRRPCPGERPVSGIFVDAGEVHGVTDK